MSERSDQPRDAGAAGKPDMLDARTGEKADERALSSQLRKARVSAALFHEPVAAVQLAHFVLLEELGAGGMGEIYAAYDEKLDRKVAIKLVRPGTDTGIRADERLLREAQTLARLSHPNVVQVYEADVYRGRVFIAMEFIRGTPLDRWLKKATDRAGQTRQRDILRLFTAAGRGLQAAHAAGLVHRDFKPDNVLVGEDGRPRVVDFGLARAAYENAAASSDPMFVSSRRDATPTLAGDVSKSEPRSVQALTESGLVLGTPHYMAPEQMRDGVADSRSDQYSFCLALFEALDSQKNAFEATSFEELLRAKERAELHELPATVPPKLRKALERGLSPEPAERFPSMAELLDVLEQDTERGRRSWLPAILILLIIAGSALFTIMSKEYERPCARAGWELDSLWTAERKESLRDAFTRTALPYSETTWRQVERQIDDYVSAWKGSSIEVCEATHVKYTQSAELMDRRMECLRGARRQVEALVDSLDEADRLTVERAVEVTAALPDLGYCDDSKNLLYGVAPPTQEVATEVGQVRDALAVARVHERFGRYTEARRIADAHRIAAENVPYRPVYAEALYAAGRIRLYSNKTADVAEGERMLLDASYLAESNRHDRLLAWVRSDLLYSAVRHPEKDKPGDERAKRARSSLERIGSPYRLHAKILRLQGLLAYNEDDYEQAEQLLRRALALVPSEPEATTLSTVLSRGLYHHDLARTLQQQGTLRPARANYDKARKLFADGMGVMERAM